MRANAYFPPALQAQAAPHLRPATSRLMGLLMLGLLLMLLAVGRCTRTAAPAPAFDNAAYHDDSPRHA